jgi:predicted TIM-barrel fold metal-dependent hydrolase
MMNDVERMALEYRRRRDALRLFDACCWLGRPLEPAFTTVDQWPQLKAALTRYGIRRAVISHSAGVTCGAEEGNRAVLDAIERAEDFVAGVTLVPEMARGAQWHALLRGLVARRARLVRLFPAAHNYLLTFTLRDGMLDALREHRLPLVVWNTQTTWPAIAAVCEHFPDLTVVVEGVQRKLFYDNRVFYELLDRFPNLFLETHNLVNYLGLDDLVRRFGSERLLFGSFFPHLDPNAAAMLLTDGEMSQRDRENIAHGNLERLLAEVDQR